MKYNFIVIAVLFLTGCSIKVPNTWEHRVEKLPIKEIPLHVEIKGEGKPLIMLHGFGSSSYSFHHLIKPLSKKYRVYNFDLKGFGNSPKPHDKRYSAYDQAVLISQFIKEHNLQDITFIGHSYGGSVALSLALMDQDNIAKMVLISPAAYKQYLPKLIRWLQKPFVGVMGYYILPTSYEVKESYRYAFYDKQKIPQETVDILTRNLKKDKYAYYLASYDLIPDDIDEVSQKYKTIQIPTLILWGENDIVIPKNRAYRLKNDLPNARLKMVDQCGHIPHEERPKAVLKYILDFL
ncbi:MAG: alpha/beta hydrolase [Epsilonproteobacteria bacterium]|nr:alpha/beta hydrolase [Campylobacterota bacterium]